MPQLNDLSRSLVALDQDSTIIAVVELSQSSWLVAGMLPGIERQPRKKLEPSAEKLLGLLHRWRDEAVKAGRKITRIALAFEAGRDGFWLARWLRARGGEAHVIHASSVAVSREHRRAKTDRLDTELLKRGSWGGCAGNGATAPWRASRPLPKRTPSGPTGSASAWSGSARASSTERRAPWPGWAFATSNQPCARRRSVLEHYTYRRARRCRRMSRPSCSAI